VAIIPATAARTVEGNADAMIPPVSLSPMLCADIATTLVERSAA